MKQDVNLNRLTKSSEYIQLQLVSLHQNVPLVVMMHCLSATSWSLNYDCIYLKKRGLLSISGHNVGLKKKWTDLAFSSLDHFSNKCIERTHHPFLPIWMHNRGHLFLPVMNIGILHFLKIMIYSSTTLICKLVLSRSTLLSTYTKLSKSCLKLFCFVLHALLNVGSSLCS